MRGEHFCDEELIMRNPERLDSFYEKITQIHKEKFPDWRFGQLFSNFAGWLYQVKHIDCFFPEEDDMIKYLAEYAGEIK